MSDRRVSAALFALTFVAYAYFFNGAGWNSNAQFDLVRAIIEEQTFAIDKFASNTGDVSFFGGHTYSNKPPGASLLAVIPYALLVSIERDPDAPMTQIANLWIITMWTCGVSGALIPVLLYRYARKRGVTQRRATAVSLTVAFATFVFAYSTVYFAHVPAALFLLAAFVYLDERPLLAGASAGAAGLCYYVAIPAALILAILALSRSRRNALHFILGGLPFAIALLGYHQLLFGSPFANVVENNERFTEKDAVLGVFHAPRFDVLRAILFSKYRGLFFLSPVLLLAFFVKLRRDFVAVFAIFAMFVFVNTSFNGWHGGSAIGPRYILPAVPLLAIPMFHLASRWRWLAIALSAWSFAINLLVTAVNPMPSRVIEDPVGAYIVPLFVTGRLDVPPQPLWSWKVMLGHVSVNAHAPFERYPYSRFPPGSPVARWASFNLGELVAENSPWSVLPVAVWIVGGSVCLLRKSGVAS